MTEENKILELPALELAPGISLVLRRAAIQGNPRLEEIAGSSLEALLDDPYAQNFQLLVLGPLYSVDCLQDDLDAIGLERPRDYFAMYHSGGGRAAEWCQFRVIIADADRLARSLPIGPGHSVIVRQKSLRRTGLAPEKISNETGVPHRADEALVVFYEVEDLKPVEELMEARGMEFYTDFFDLPETGGDVAEWCEVRLSGKRAGFYGRFGAP